MVLKWKTRYIFRYKIVQSICLKHLFKKLGFFIFYMVMKSTLSYFLRSNSIYFIKLLLSVSWISNIWLLIIHYDNYALDVTSEYFTFILWQTVLYILLKFIALIWYIINVLGQTCHFNSWFMHQLLINKCYLIVNAVI